MPPRNKEVDDALKAIVWAGHDVNESTGLLKKPNEVRKLNLPLFGTVATSTFRNKLSMFREQYQAYVTANGTFLR